MAPAELWYACERGVNHGPYTAEMLQERVAAGCLTPAALVWKEGLTSWQPLAAHFPEIPKTVRSGKPMAGSRYLLLAAAIALFILLLFSRGLTDDFSSKAFLATRLVLILVTVLAATVCAILWWRRVPDIAESQAGRGWLRIGIIAGALAAAALAFVFVARTPLLYRIQVATDAFNDYVVQVDGAHKLLKIEGTIGPGMASKVIRQLGANADIATVEIDSIGGLVDEALKIARYVQSHNLGTRATKTCNSACILVFMAGNRRVASRSMAFGFHETASVTPVSGVFDLQALDASARESKSYLRSRGVPEHYIQSAHKLGPEQLFPVSAIEMAEAGAVSALEDRGAPVSLNQAKWRDVVDMLAHGKSSASLLLLMRTTERVAPATIDKQAPALWSTAMHGGKEEFAAAIYALLSAQSDKALVAADDRSLMAIVRVTRDEFAFLRQGGKWAACAEFSNGHGLHGVHLPAKIRDADYDAQTAIVESAVKNDWKKRSFTPQGRSQGRLIGALAARKTTVQGFDPQTMHADPRVSCVWRANLFAELSTWPDSAGANAYRWIIAGAK
jgi:hypothetical protein